MTSFFNDFIAFMLSPMTQVFISFTVALFASGTFLYRVVQYFRSKPSELFWFAFVAISHWVWMLKLISLR